VNHGLIGIISGQAAVDYPAKRVYFASRAFGSAPNDNTLWCLDLVTQKACWAQPYGDIDGGVSLRGDRIYVGTTGGSVLAVNASDGSPGWTFTPGVPDGPVKGYVVTDWQTDDVYFATSTRVWSLSDTGPITFSHNWLSTGVLYANPSTPVYAPGDPWVYVGGDGKLSRLSVLDGSEMSFFAIGDGSARVGSPTIDLGNNFAYVGTDVGIVSAVQLP
jgi:outer membrane protein assembly factor BamB